MNIKLIEEHFREVLERNKSKDIRNDFFKIEVLGDLKFRVDFLKGKEHVFSTNLTEYFTLTCRFPDGIFTYEVEINKLTYKNNYQESGEYYIYEVLKLLGYIVKSHEEKNKFYTFLENMFKTDMLKEVELYKKTFENYIENTLKNNCDIPLTNQFEEPPFLIIENHSIEHYQRKGEDYWDEKVWYSLRIYNIEVAKKYNLDSIEDCLYTITNPYNDSLYGSGLINHEYSLTRELLAKYGSEYKKLEDYTRKLNSHKIYIVLFFIFGDLQKLFTYIQTLHFYSQYLYCRDIKKFLDSDNYSIFDFDTKKFSWDFVLVINFMEKEIREIFDHQWLYNKMQHIIIKTDRMPNNELINLFKLYFTDFKK